MTLLRPSSLIQLADVGRGVSRCLNLVLISQDQGRIQNDFILASATQTDRLGSPAAPFAAGFALSVNHLPN